MTRLYRYKFGSVVFNEGSFELSVDGGTVDIQRKPLQVLNLLLQNAGKAVPREDFFRQIWRGQPTVDNVLANAIVKLRNALGPAQSSSIENIPRVGYRLNASIERSVVAGSGSGTLKFQPGEYVPRREHFKLEQLLGASNANEVWLARHVKTGEARVFKFASAEQHLAPLKREVTLARLLRNALGDRPDFVRVIDWNFSESPYFVESEYGGVNLAEWAAADGRLAGMALADRLALFQQIAQAVSSAHALAVLHKDLKPSNVLVGSAGAGWQCRLVDFGSGRLLDMARLGELGITPLGLTVANGLSSDAARGTLLYAAPELLADEPATVRSDIYALGVLLYQIVVADLERGLGVGWERDIEDDLLRADIARATDRDPAQRFGSASELADALAALSQRHEARRVAQTEAQRRQRESDQLQALQRRRPWLYALIGVLLLGLLTTLGLYAQLRSAREQTARELATKAALNKFLIDDFISAANPSITGRRNISVADAATTAAGKVDTTLAKAPPEVRASVHAALQRAFDSLSDYHATLVEGDKALAEWGKSAVVDPDQQIRIQLLNAKAQTYLGSVVEADKLFAQVEARLTALDSAQPALQARWFYGRGVAKARRLLLKDSLSDLEAAWALAKAPAFSEPDLAEQIELQLSDAHNMVGHPDAAERLARDLIARQVARWGEHHVRPCYTRAALANTLSYKENYKEHMAEALSLASEATKCLASALGPTSQQSLSAQRILASVEFIAEHFKEAAALYAKLAESFSVAESATSMSVLSARTNVASALHLGGQLAEADVAFDAALGGVGKAFSDTFPAIQLLRFGAARNRLDLGSTRGVAGLLRDLDPAALKIAAQEPDWPARLSLQRGRLALMSGDRAQAIELLNTARSLEAQRKDAADEIKEIDRWLAKAGAAPPPAAAASGQS